ncbi:MAG: HAD family phosphatase [Lachnospiraceae bacterium]|nr:HAD family phosphatase [Lachnospiraceae bacterium]
MRLKGVIFDLDGTILDSTWVWHQIDIDFLGKYGFSVPDDYVEKITPMGFGEAARYTIERFRLKASPEEVMAEWNEMAMEAYSKQVRLRTGTKEVLQWLKNKGIPAGVATSNNASLFEPCLINNGVYQYFHSFTEIREVSRGKEFPDIYIKEAEKLGCLPGECLVFEDIIPALKSAKQGGFVTVGVQENAWCYGAGIMKESCDYQIAEIEEAISLLEQLAGA